MSPEEEAKLAALIEQQANNTLSSKMGPSPTKIPIKPKMTEEEQVQNLIANIDQSLQNRSKFKNYDSRHQI